MRSFTFMTLASLMFVLASCATARDRHLTDVRVGMEKAEVLDLMGGPDVTRRWHGQDRWIYHIADSAGKRVREVHFLDGKVSYAGDQVPAESSAEEQDQRNEEKNLAEEARLADIKAKQKEMVRKFNEGEPTDETNYKVLPKYQELK